jgi:hypothetical protein
MRRSTHPQTTRARRFLTVAALCLGLMLGRVQQAHGQPIEELEFGARAGINLGNVAFNGEDDVDSSLKLGLVAGAFLVMPLSGSLALQIEGLYSAKGVKVTTQGFESKLVTDYLEIPLLVRWGRRSGGNGYYLAGGGAPALRLRAKTVADFGNATESIEIGDQVERFDVGIVIGGGIERGRWVFDGRYSFGVLDIDRDKSDDVEMKHRVISVTAGWRF